MNRGVRKPSPGESGKLPGRRSKYVSLVSMSVLVLIIGVLLTLVLPRVLPEGSGLATPSATIASPAFTLPPFELPVPDTPPPTPTPAPRVYQLRLGGDGSLTENAQVVSDDGLAVLSLARGTKVTDAEGQPLASITLTVRRLALRADVGVVGAAYEFGPEGATLDPPATLTMSYDPQAYYPFQYPSQVQVLTLPYPLAWQNNGRVYMAYMEENGALQPALTSVSSPTASITAGMDHLGTIILYIL
jgi:hypothetical protein